MAVGSHYEEETPDVEVVALGSNPACAKPPDLPQPTSQSPPAALVDGAVTVCDGRRTRDCFRLVGGAWQRAPFQMLNEREDPVFVVMGNGSWLIFGGGGEASQTSEVLENGRFRPGPSLPNKMCGEGGCCAVKLGAYLMFVYEEKSAYLVQLDSWSWNRIADTNNYAKDASCGVVTNANGLREIIVAGGGEDKTRVESYLLDGGNGGWIEHPDFERGVDLASMATVPHASAFIVVGGRDSTKVSQDTLWDFDPASHTFVQRAEKLQLRREMHTAIPLAACPTQ